MGTQKQVHHPFECVLPPDFPARLVRFKEASGLTWRSLARLLGVSPYRLTLSIASAMSPINASKVSARSTKLTGNTSSVFCSSST